jgi:hypothetical protein
MSFKKTGSGQVTGTEGTLSKTAAQDDWTEQDEQELAEENASVDGEK